MSVFTALHPNLPVANSCHSHPAQTAQEYPPSSPNPKMSCQSLHIYIPYGGRNTLPGGVVNNSNDEIEFQLNALLNTYDQPQINRALLIRNHWPQGDGLREKHTFCDQISDIHNKEAPPFKYEPTKYNSEQDIEEISIIITGDLQCAHKKTQIFLNLWFLKDFTWKCIV